MQSMMGSAMSGGQFKSLIHPIYQGIIYFLNARRFYVYKPQKLYQALIPAIDKKEDSTTSDSEDDATS